MITETKYQFDFKTMFTCLKNVSVHRHLITKGPQALKEQLYFTLQKIGNKKIEGSPLNLILKLIVI